MNDEPIEQVTWVEGKVTESFALTMFIIFFSYLINVPPPFAACEKAFQ